MTLVAHAQPAAADSPAWVALLAAAALVALYLWAARAERRRGRRWSGWRAASFVLGVAVIAGALLPPLAAWADQDLREHMVQHVLVGMLGPIGLVLGAPITLALRALPVRMAQSLVRALHTAPARTLAHPAIALVLNVGGMAAIYLTPLYGLMGAHPALHAAVHAHFVAAGCLFTWSVAGPDRIGPRPAASTRLAVLFVAIAAHATLAKAMYAYGWPAGHPIVEVEQAAQLMYYGGDLAELLLLIALFARWPGARRQIARPIPAAGACTDSRVY